jgi:serine/threonine-protein kinase
VNDGARAALATALSGTHDIEHELEGGGMSRVFVAQERALGRRVVIKMLGDVGHTVDAARFRHEILLSAGLQHPHIVPVHTAGEAGGVPYFVMPFVEGVSLRTRLRDGGALGIGEATRVLRDVASAIYHAHARGIVHRDLKPENVMLSGGSAVVLDFGVAKALAAGTQEHPSDGTHNFTGAGFAVGTPRYMAPEQAAGDPALDGRADIYAFGVLAFEVFTGRPPFDGPPADVLRKQIMEAPPDIGIAGPSLPPTLVALVRACLSKSPVARPQDAGALLDALDGVRTPLVGTQTIVAEPRVKVSTSAWMEAMAVPASYVVVAGVALGYLFHLADAEKIREGVLAAAIIGSLLGFPLAVAGGLLLRIVARDRRLTMRQG